ncbi:MAG: mechanosensitive ion channel [Magnetococcales bacterium]|nr:mechanosensitive ion channel [Magnetococcales bacterium]
MQPMLSRSLSLVIVILWGVSLASSGGAAEKGALHSPGAAEPKKSASGSTEQKKAAPGSAEQKSAAPASTLTAVTPLWRFKAPQEEQVRTVLELLAKEVGDIAADVSPDSKDGQRRTALQKRIELYGGWQEIMARRQVLERLTGAETTNLAEVEKRLQELKSHLPVPVPVSESPTPGIVEKIQSSLADRNRDIELAATSLQQAQQLLQENPQKVAQAKEKAKESAEIAAKIAKMSDKAVESGKSLTDLQIGNAELEQRVVQEQIARFQAEELFAKLSMPRREKNLEMAQLLLDQEQKRLNLYQEALDRHLEQDRRNKEAELQKKLQAEEEASTPQQKFLTRLETETLQVQRNIADLQQLRAGIAREISEQEKRLQTEKAELENLKTLVRQYGPQGPAADMLKSTYRLLKQRRRDLSVTIPPALDKQQEKLQERRLDIATHQAALDDEWQREKEILLRHLPDKQRDGFAKQSQKLLDEYHRTLTSERRFAFEVSIEWQRLALLPRDRQNVLGELEAFVLANVFWIQDADPLSGKLLRVAWQEVVAVDNPRSLRQEWKRLADPDNIQGFSLDLTIKEGYLLLGGVLVVLPGFLFFIHRRLRWVSRARHEEETRNDVSANGMNPFLRGTLQAALVPTWFLVTALLVEPFIQTMGYRVALSRASMHLALLFFLWSLVSRLPKVAGRTLFGFCFPEDWVRTLFTASRIVLWAYLLFMLPWAILDGPPFALRVLPRIFFTLFEISLAVAFYQLIRPASPFLRHALAGMTGSVAQADGKDRILRHPWLAWVWWLLLTAVVGLDGAGYRFGAAQLTRNGLLTLVTVLLLMGIHRLLDRIPERLGLWQEADAVPEKGSDSIENIQKLQSNMRRFSRLFLILTGVFLIASYWGVNEQALTALSQINLYSVTGVDGKIEFVTVADLVRFSMTLFLTFWLLAHVSSLLHLLIFSHWQVTEGSRYAVVMITRYALFLVGFLVAISWLRLDPGRLGWLVAALGVGLGFGLQEIVANFVSGIILLVERPIRVSDWITVGDVHGTVTQINIRATRVQNRDHQEILIPNRELITRQVTNWTLSNTSIRLCIPIGVAYGTSLERVRETLLGLARQQPEVMATPPPRVLFMRHGESSLDFELWVFLPQPDLQISMRDRLNTLINVAFAREKIEIPFPQREVHIRYPDREKAPA